MPTEEMHLKSSEQKTSKSFKRGCAVCGVKDNLAMVAIVNIPGISPRKHRRLFTRVCSLHAAAVRAWRSGRTMNPQNPEIEFQEYLKIYNAMIFQDVYEYYYKQ